VREGIVAGLLGAGTIVAWFLILDSLAGHPLHTPSILGSTLVHGGWSEEAGIDQQSVSIGLVVLYTLVHGAAFCVVGTIAERLFLAAERHPPFIFALVLLFFLFFAGFMTVTFLFAFPVLQELSVSAVVTGNLLAAAAMVSYLWRHHPLDLRQLL